MAALNKRPPRFAETTHEGAPAVRTTAMQALRRTVMSNLLWEDGYYESGQDIAGRLQSLALSVPAQALADTAVEAREVAKLRHAPLLLAVMLARVGSGSSLVSQTLSRVIQRADELSEFLALYWSINPKRADGRSAPLSAQVKLGLAQAVQKFDAYQLAKYDRERAVSLRDVIFLSHAKPGGRADGATIAKLVNKDFVPVATKSASFAVREAYALDGAFTGLEAPDTWEVALSAGGDKKAEFTRLLETGKLGYLALLRNLRNMVDSGVDRDLITTALLARKGGAERVLPFRYIAAARAAPSLEPAIDKALVASLDAALKIDGRTFVLVDVSGSMKVKLSGKSDLTRMDAACTLGAMFPCDDLRLYSFSIVLKEVPARRGMAGVEAISASQPHGGTNLAGAIAAANTLMKPTDRLVVITDEQAMAGTTTSRRGLPDPVATRAYMINVASDKNGVGYGRWTHIDGFSENVLRYIAAFEAADLFDLGVTAEA